MNIIVIMKFMRNSFEVSSVAATMLPSGWWALDLNHLTVGLLCDHVQMDLVKDQRCSIWLLAIARLHSTVQCLLFSSYIQCIWEKRRCQVSSTTAVHDHELVAQISSACMGCRLLNSVT